MVIALRGKLNDRAAEPEIQWRIQKHLEAFSGDLILDCTALESLNSTGLNILLNLLQAYRTAARKVIVAGANNTVHGVLKITQLNSVFGLEKDVETAVRNQQQTTQKT